MYGTVARFRVKPGMEARLVEFCKMEESVSIPGYKGAILYRLDSKPSEMLLAIAFEDKESYVKNADSPEQDARYREFVQLLEGEPQWQDGEIIYSM